MAKWLIIISSILVAVMVALFVMGYLSQSGTAPGLVDGRLKPCPKSPNCVNSEFKSDNAHYIEPLLYSPDDPMQAMSSLKAIIIDMGGSIQAEEPGYLAATFTTTVFRFVDDLEVKIDTEHKTIQLRSASRVGHGDGGANRKRVELLKQSFMRDG